MAQSWQAIAHQQFKCKTSSTPIGTYGLRSRKCTHSKSTGEYEKKIAVRLMRLRVPSWGEIFSSNLNASTQEHFNADMNSLYTMLFTGIIPPGQRETIYPSEIKLHPKLKPFLKVGIFPAFGFFSHSQQKPIWKVGAPAQPLRVGDVFESDQIEYLHLYLLVVRAFMIMRSALSSARNKSYHPNSQEGDTLFIAIRKKLSDFLLPYP